MPSENAKFHTPGGACREFKISYKGCRGRRTFANPMSNPGCKKEKKQGIYTLGQSHSGEDNGYGRQIEAHVL